MHSSRTHEPEQAKKPARTVVTAASPDISYEEFFGNDDEGARIVLQARARQGLAQGQLPAARNRARRTARVARSSSKAAASGDDDGGGEPPPVAGCGRHPPITTAEQTSAVEALLEICCRAIARRMLRGEAP